MKKKLLIIEAHSDDSAISISGFLDKYRDIYEIHFMLMVCSDIVLHHCGLVSREQRLAEYQNYVDSFHGHWHRGENFPFDNDATMDTVPRRNVISAIEKGIAAVQPDVLICQGPSFHQDHTIVYESMIAATRPTSLFYPKEIYITENPTYVHSVGPQTVFTPNLYVDLTEEQVQRKLELFRCCFPSQFRSDDNYLAENGIRSWARYRGIEARCLYAEAMRTHVRII